MKFDEKLQKLRKASGMNQEMLADKLGVSRQAVSKWESGASYPETDKLIQMSKIFNCTLDELVNDSETDKTIIKNNISKKNMYLDSFIEFITKSVNMFSRMKLSNLIKSFIELIIIAFILIGISAILWIIGGTLINDVIFGFYVESDILWSIICFIRNLVLGCYFALLASIDFIIYLQIYKIRYLDYYDKLVYEYDQKREIKEEVKEEKKIPEVEKKDEVKIETKRNDKIVIRDPEHRPFAFLSVISKFIVNIFKFIVGCLGILFVASLIFFVVWFVLSVYLATVNDLFGGVIIALIGVIVFNILLIELVYEFVNSIKVNKIRVLVQGLMCIIIGSIGVGLTIIELKDIDFIEYGDDQYFVEEVIDFDTDVNTLVAHNYYDTALIIDDSIEQGLEFKINYNKELNSYEFKIVDNEIVLVVDSKVDTIKKALDYQLHKLNNNEILLFDLYDRVYVEVRGNKETILNIIGDLRDQKDIIYTDQNNDGSYHAW